MRSDEFLALTLYAELADINTLLEPAGVTNETDGTILPSQLDRAQAEKEATSEMSAAMAKNSVEAIAAASRLIHEASRARRDIKIARASHKQLMLGSYRTLYQRKLKLEKDIQEERYV